MSPALAAECTTGDAARRLGVGERWVRRAVADGLVPAVPRASKQGRPIRLTAESVRALAILRTLRRLATLSPAKVRALGDLHRARGRVLVLSPAGARIVAPGHTAAEVLAEHPGGAILIAIPT